MRITVETSVEYYSSSGVLSLASELSTEVEFDEEDSQDTTTSEIITDQLNQHVQYHKAQKYEASKQCVD